MELDPRVDDLLDRFSATEPGHANAVHQPAFNTMMAVTRYMVERELEELLPGAAGLSFGEVRGFLDVACEQALISGATLMACTARGDDDPPRAEAHEVAFAELWQAVSTTLEKGSRALESFHARLAQLGPVDQAAGVLAASSARHFCEEHDVFAPHMERVFKLCYDNVMRGALVEHLLAELCTLIPGEVAAPQGMVH